jgi:hypothetical protein|tara:strand:+ start:289 stop:489 length:201 start_codon:yes stop_codon:yes gene_type:complete
MQVSITFTSNTEEDGFIGSTTLVRDDVEDLHTLATVYADAARAGGFTYVESVAFEKDDGQMVFSDW